MPITLVGESQFGEWAPGWGPSIEWDNDPAPYQDPPGIPQFEGNRQDSWPATNLIAIDRAIFGVQDNEFFVATIFVKNHGGTTITPPSGWTLIRRDNFSFVAIATYYKLVTDASSEPATWDFSLNAVKDSLSYVQRIGGIDASGDPVRSQAISGAASGTTLTLPQVAMQCEDLVYYIGYTETGEFYPFSPTPGFSGGYIDEYYTASTGGVHVGFTYGYRNGNHGPFDGVLSVPNDNARMQVFVFKKATTVGKITAPLPSGGVQAGDVLIASISVNACPEGIDQIVPSAGWTKIREDSTLDSGDFTQMDNALDGLGQTLFYRVATNSEPSSYDFLITDRGHPHVYYTPYWGWVRAYRGVNTSTPIADSGGVTGTGDPTLPTLPSVTASAPGSLLLSIASAQFIGPNQYAALIPDPPLVQASLVSRNTQGAAANMLMTISEQGLPSSGATGTKTYQPKLPPQVFDVQPNIVGDSETGIIITGQSFSEVTAVKFNGINAISFVIDNDGQITANAPSTGYGDFSVEVVNNIGSGGFSPYTVTTWFRKADMPVSRFRHALTELPDGKVLMTGGHSNTSDFGLGHEDCYYYDPSNDTWTAAGSLPTDRFATAVILLPNGKVLLSGGVTFGGSQTNTCRLYDPGTNTWSAAGSMARARAGHTLTLLSNGKILAAGGDNQVTPSKTSELYDPVANTWGSLANLAPDSGSTSQNHVFHIACRLPSDLSNRVVILGGTEPQNPDDSDKRGYVQIYTPSSNTWSRGARMPTKVDDCGVVVLSDNRIVVIGGHKTDNTTFDGIQIYDIGTDSWSALTSLYPNGGIESGYAVVLTTDEILVFGGYGFGGRFDSYLIDVDADTITSMGNLPRYFNSGPYNRYYTRNSGSIGGTGPGAIRLSDGRVLLVGGFDNGLQTDIFTRP